MSDDSKQVAVTGRKRPPNAGKGRPKGSLNKTTANTKAALEAAFQKLGGTNALVAWAQKEPTEFYRLWSKLIPADLKLSGDAENPVAVAIAVTHQVVDASGGDH